MQTNAYKEQPKITSPVASPAEETPSLVSPVTAVLSVTRREESAGRDTVGTLSEEFFVGTRTHA